MILRELVGGHLAVHRHRQDRADAAVAVVPVEQHRHGEDHAEVNRIKVKYFGDAEAIGERQTELNKNTITIRCFRWFLLLSRSWFYSVWSR